MVASTDGGATTRNIIDPIGLGNVVGQYDSSGNLVTRYDYGLGLVSQIDATGQAAYYDFDSIGSTVGLSDSTGNQINSYSYDAFGSVLKSSESVSNPFRFVGESGVISEGNGLDLMRARFFDPLLGRFTTTDPVVYLGNANLYSYAANSPTDGIDPLGLWTIDIGASGGAGAGGTGGIRIGGGTVCIYGGAGATTPGLSAGITFSTASPSTGVEIQGEGAVGPGVLGAIYGKSVSITDGKGTVSTSVGIGIGLGGSKATGGSLMAISTICLPCFAHLLSADPNLLAAFRRRTWGNPRREPLTPATAMAADHLQRIPQTPSPPSPPSPSTPTRSSAPAVTVRKVSSQRISRSPTV